MTPDYSGQNLQGRSFRGQNLEGANFSYADIRSADFTGANLIGANFSHAKAGLQRRRAIFLVIVSLLLSGLSGSMLGIAGYIGAQGLNSSQTSNQIASWSVIIAFVTFCLLAIRYGIQAGLGVLTGVGVVIGLLSVINFAPLIVITTAASIGIGSVAVASVGAVIIAIAGTFTLAGAIIGAVAGVIPGILISGGVKVFTITFTIAFTFPAVVVLLSFYISWQAIKGNKKYTIVRNVAIAFIAIGGTSYRKANLTDANFTETILKSTDFREATLTRTYWWNARKLDLALPGTTYLQNVLVRQLVITGDGKNKNYDRLDLQGLNLQEANLENSSFIDTDFYKATLRKANLSRAILVRAQMERADLRGACLTGSCIQDWTISRETKLDGIICDYVYLKWVDGDKRDQMPPRGKFKEGGFVTFVKYILDTVELYHEKDINPRLALTVLQKMARDYDEPLEVVALGKRGEKVFIQVKVSERIIQDQFQEDYYSRYDEDLKLWSSNSQQLPPAINNLIENKLTEIASEKTDHFVFIDVTHVEGNYIPTYQGDITMTGERTINMGDGNYNERIEGDYIQGNSYKGKQSNFNLQGAQFAGGLVDAETVNAHQIGGDITNYNQVSRTEANNSPVKTILILAANPRNTSPLRLGEEVREIDAGLQRAKKRELFDLKQRWAVRVQEVYQSLLDFKPQIVHFSGHGSGDDGLALGDETGNVRLVDTVALAGLFELFASDIECVVLNACYSEVQAQAIVKHIPYVIGMNKAIGDKAAIKFATGFYSALGAGESVEFAYKLGCSVIQLEGIAENLTPILKKK